MTEKRIQFNQVVENQLPSYVKEEFPLIAEFLKQYYISQEFQGASTDLIQNIDQYIKLDSIKSKNIYSSTLTSDVLFFDTAISVTSTIGFPDSYGLLLIDNEIITYTSKTDNSFEGCIRGFSGVTSYNDNSNIDELIFESSEIAEHKSKVSDGDTEVDNQVINLSSLFLKEFFNKVKYQLVPGFEKREFYNELDEYLFLKQSKDFYSTRGTDLSYKILFKVLYGEDVRVIKPQEYLIKPSDAQYNISNKLVVESISGDPYELVNSTLFQDEYGDIPKAYVPISNVEKVPTLDGKLYYKLSFDGGYNRDIGSDGSLYGKFSVHPNTKIIENVFSGSRVINVDSTVGFPLSGELVVTYNDGTEGVITYKSKNLNQFLDCENINRTILDKEIIRLNTYAYGETNKGTGDKIKVRITSVLNDIDFVDNTYYQREGDVGVIRSLGVNDKDIFSTEWLYNISSSSKVLSSEQTLIDQIDKVYRLTTETEHNLRVGDKIKLYLNDGSERNSEIVNIISEKNIDVKGQGDLEQYKVFEIQRFILKVNDPNLSTEIANIQNVYKDKNSTLIASQSLPYYLNQQLNPYKKAVTFSQTYTASENSPLDTFTIPNHGFYTGDSVYYKSDSGSLFDDGLYFIKRVDKNNVKFAKSRSNIYSSTFIEIKETVTVTNSTIQDFDFYNKSLTSQKILKKIEIPVPNKEEYQTNPGAIGILVNGVEILNYKSKDKIYYGPIEEINVTNSGSGYDIINPPKLQITDSVGVGATGYCSVKGSLQAIQIIDPGFDYLENPNIIINGGNGFGAKANASVKLVDNQITFSSEEKSNIVNISSDSIGFTTYHRFRNAEKVIYKTEGRTSIGGISTNSSYYVSVLDLYTVKLHKTFNDAVSGINTISLTSYGSGNHILQSYDKKFVLSSINIENSGYNYENKKRTAKPEFINIYENNINIKDHNFKSGEIIKYSSSGTEIGGLTNNQEYYIIKVDDDNFKLTRVGIGSDLKDFYYKTNQVIQLTSTGSGIHNFNYPEISVEVVGRIGISSEIFSAKIQPIFRGQITSVHLENNGVGYGSSEIINFKREPLVTVTSGSECKLIPIINDGKIVEVLVNNPGKNYNTAPDLNIITNGLGGGAVLTPIVDIQSGQIKSIKIIEGGFGYDRNNTFINVVPAGSKAELYPKLKSWTVNIVSKYFNSITSDDGFIFYNPRSKYGLQYGHLYAPRKLREILYSKDSNGKNLYGISDLMKENGNEVSSSHHSPIIGWAYDGNPIYGPYGYSENDGGSVVRMRSGYDLIEPVPQNRPPFENGFFVEDYEYKNSNDDSVLDEYNGRFCVTPDFPKGTYAYFATIDSTSSNSFGNYRTPAFPYLIGNKFKSSPIDFNFNRSSNQDDIDLNTTKWTRNTSLYNLKDNTGYSYVTLPNDLNQTISLKYTSSGSIESVNIISPGDNYKVNDLISFDDSSTRGFAFSSKISKIKGKQIDTVSVASTTLYDLEIFPQEGNKETFIVQSKEPHNFVNSDIISVTSLGIITTVSSYSSFYRIGVSTNTLSVSNVSGISSSSTTGIVTFISVSGNLSNSGIRENDIFRINSEKVKILNIDNKSSRIRVLRSIDNTVGTSHSYSDILYEIPRRFLISDRQNSLALYCQEENREFYFDPKESIGIGTVSGVGIGFTLSFSNPGAGLTQIFIPTKTIYLQNHKLQTGDLLTYSSNAGTEISVSITGSTSYSLQDQTNVYVAKISDDLIGISTVKVGLSTDGRFVGIASTTSSSTTLYFTGIGTGVYHSFKTNYSNSNSQALKNTVNVALAETHGLANNDHVFVNIRSGINTTIVVKYDDYNRKILIDPRSFYSANVNVIDDSITIENHNFIKGQKVVYTADTPSGGLVNNKIYYIIVVDQNTIRLSSTFYDSITLVPDIVNITSSSDGTLSPINPPIKVYRDCSVTFDLSDSSLSYVNGSNKYSAFEFNLYLDRYFTDVFNTTGSQNEFEVQKIGKVGIDSGASLTLKINDFVPRTLFYGLETIYSELLPEEKKIEVDYSVFSNNQIDISYSEYNGEHQIVSTSSTTFSYSLPIRPEKNSYDQSSPVLEYDTSSLTAFGPISSIEILSKGQNYYTLPKFTIVNSEYGTGAILEAFSTSIGKIQKIKINDIGYDFPSDFTLKPNLSLPQILKIEPLNSFERIEIVSIGRGYVTPPKLIVIDSKTNEILPEVDLKYSFKDTEVTILNNTYSLNDIDPIIIPTQNSNGVGISSISYNSLNGNVTVTLSVGFSTANSFPFSIGDKVLIENISIGVNSTGKGYNSKNYNYQLFTINSLDENIGGEGGTVTYNLSEFLGSGEFPGTFDSENSSGRIIPEKYFPVFNSILKPNNFLKYEKLRYVGEQKELGFVQNWDERIKHLRVSSKEILEEGKILSGLSSKTQGKISLVISPNSFVSLAPYTKVENGWSKETGILNNDLQRIQDNFYYQNFSYSLKSRVPYDTWEDAVGSLNHTAGFKKFSDYQLESSTISGIQTYTDTKIEITTDINGFASLNCVYDFDLAKENALVVDSSTLLSDEITFSSRILTDYFESISNRVLNIDDISGLFNSNPRSTKYSIVHRFPLTDARGQKYVTFVKDRRYSSQRQMMLVSLVHDDSYGYLNQYGRIESYGDLGSFDFEIDGTDGLLLFYPIKYKVNNYDITTLTYNVKDNFIGIGSSNIGDIVNVNVNTVTCLPSTQTTISSIGSTYSSAKLLVEIETDNKEYQFDEISVVHDGTNVEFISYGQLSSHSFDSYSSSGLGTYYAYISGSNLNVDFIPNIEIAATVSSIQVSIADTNFTGIGTFDMKYAKLESRTTSIASSTSPTENIISEYTDFYSGAYFIIQVSDITNNNKQVSEVVALNNSDEAYFTEFGNLETQSGLGTIGISKETGSTQLKFTPIPDIDVQVKVFSNFITNYDNINSITEYNNKTIVTDYGIYYGTEIDVRRSFYLTHKSYPIFERYFDGSDSSVVSVGSSTIKIKNHFFVTGEKVRYSYSPEISNSYFPIGIASTDFGVGIGTTDKLPSSVYIIKLDNNTIKLARSAEDALRIVPKALEITSLGIGTIHSFTSINQNTKAIISIDNVIQSPVVSSSTTTYLSNSLTEEEDLLYCDSTTNIFLGDLIKIGDEIMKVESVGVGSTNSIRVVRPWMGTDFDNHSIGSTVTKLNGNYNIVDNVLNFAEAPYGNIPLGTSTNPPDERDWLGISTSSSFHGRTFMRTSEIETSNEPYSKNYIFDDISSQFDGIEETFSLKSNNSNLTEIYEDNAVILINDIFQGPGLSNDYYLQENIGITTITFTGSPKALDSDINTSNLPSGGIIVSVGSTNGFGYQPLISAGGTAVVSVAGTISSISIGNSGSGYRSHIQTPSGIVPIQVRVGVATSSLYSPNIEFIGTAAVSNGNIVSIAITNPGVGYTSSNPPYVVIDDPISYSDIPLIYSSSSSSGVGTQATVDIVVGQGSSVVDFEIKNIGYGYRVGEILTIPVGGIVGIPTVANSSLSEFKIFVDRVFIDKFAGWTLGELQVLDNIERLFNGKRTIFPLLNNSEFISIYARKGSEINIQDTLLVFVNDILQVPGEGYIFNGGSKIQFTEAPKPEDTCKILFYKGSGEGIDVIFQDIIETVKLGDDLTLTYDTSLGQTSALLENPRFVTDILSIDTVETNPYFGPGNTDNESLVRPITWCRQTEDLIINELEVSKDRSLYEPRVYPSSYLIQSVGIGSSIIFVDNIRPFFNPSNENSVSLDFQKNVTLISQDTKVSASATAVVSTSGTITSIVINDGGYGYNFVPEVTIQNPVGVGTTTTLATASVTSGIVTFISLQNTVSGYSTTNPPVVLIGPPTLDKESNRVLNYSGDFGFISGVSTSSVGVASTALVFDFVIPKDSYLRDSLIMGISGVTTVSGIQTGYYFVVSNSNIGYGLTSLDSSGSIIGIGTSFIDGVYQVASVSIAQTSVTGLGVTYVAKVTVSVSNYNGLTGIGYSRYYGNYSWGRVVLRSRSKQNSYNSYTLNGYVGISSGSILSRTSPLKYLNYIP